MVSNNLVLKNLLSTWPVRACVCVHMCVRVCAHVCACVCVRVRVWTCVLYMHMYCMHVSILLLYTHYILLYCIYAHVYMYACMYVTHCVVMYYVVCTRQSEMSHIQGKK